MLSGVVFADVQRGETCGAIRSQVKGEDPFCSIGRRCMTLIDTRGISGPPLGEHSGRGGQAEPAKRQQVAYEDRTGTHDE